MKPSTFVASITASLLVTGVHAGRAADAQVAQVSAAVAGLYRALAARDVASLAEYLPAEGFSEFSPPESHLKTLDLEYFRRAFAARVDAAPRAHLRLRRGGLNRAKSTEAAVP